MATERQKKTPAQRAEEALDVALRQETRALDRLKAAEEAVPPLKKEAEAAQARVRYLLANPDLPENVREMYAEEKPEGEPELPPTADA